MQIIDFGKNIYQFEIYFKFDLVSVELVRAVAEFYASKDRPFVPAKDASVSGQTLLTRGNGTEQDPFLQIKLSPDKVGVWVGWHYPYDEWLKTRDAITEDFGKLFQNVRPAFVAAVAPQVSLVVPFERMKEMSEVKEFAPILNFHQRYTPPDLLEKFSLYHVFGDSGGSKTLDWNYEATNDQGTFRFQSRLFALDKALSIKENLTNHFSRFDSLLTDFQSNVVKPLLK